MKDKGLKMDKEKLQELLQKLKSDKKLLMIVMIGIAGMLLLLATEWMGNDKSSSTTATKPQDVQLTYEQNYKEQVESDLQKLISSIDGAGKTKVMITLDSSSKSVYAVDEQVDESKEPVTNGDNVDEKVKYSSDKEHVIVKTSDKDETGLIIEVIQPQIRGVAVVCEGADSAVVKKNITDTITAVLNISSTRVCISKMSH